MKHSPQLDGLRAIAFVGVFLAHWFQNQLWWGGFGVQVFFVLSGFLITGILIRSDQGPLWPRYRAFFMRRALRVMPVYFMLLGVMAAFGHTRFFPWLGTYTFNVRVWMLSDHSQWAELMGNWFSEGLHLWSMSVEEQFYLLYPFALAVVPRRRRGLALGLGIAVSISLRIALDRHNHQAYYGALLPVCGEYILWGCLLSVLQFEGKLDRIPALPALVSGLLLFAVLIPLGAPVGQAVEIFAQFIPVPRPGVWWAYCLQTGYAVAFTLWIFGLWKSDRHLISRALAWSPLAYLGKISYGLYLFHLPLWFLGMPDGPLLRRWPSLAQPENQWVVFVVLIGSTIGAASLSWFALERPLNQLKHRFPYPDGHSLRD